MQGWLFSVISLYTHEKKEETDRVKIPCKFDYEHFSPKVLVFPADCVWCTLFQASLSFSFFLSLFLLLSSSIPVSVSLTSLPCFSDTKIHPVSLFFWSVILFLVFSPDGRRLTPLFICLHGLIRSSLCLVFYLLSLSRNDMLWTRKFPKYYPFYMSLSSLSLYLTSSLRCRRALREILASFPLRSLLVFHSRA